MVGINRYAQRSTAFQYFPWKKNLSIAETLGLNELITRDYSYLDTDPKDKDVIDHVSGAIDTYIVKAENMEDGSKLVQRGEEMRERLCSVGFHAATFLALLGRKPPNGI